ncbi:MAG: DUF1573 domain-containing protein [Chloroflexi bacterium]|nr:DUF1573 domain-containing protein [Chloroflexota bacterium]MCI0578493.1 DUF1573 domain-containing protein [Chloroflexota bacterium]MCI0648490.1 DUF1573 domain-containing protein [Chloroflexota bacterium]MCI0726014.1 DUF1573 domain-containing protein [Chloroflexota bacterium]
MNHNRSKRVGDRRKRQAGAPAPLLLGVAGLLLIVGALLAYLGAGSESTKWGGTPQLVVDQERMDFGDVQLGEWVTASFTLSNTGDGPVRFTETPFVEVAAGC